MAWSVVLENLLGAMSCDNSSTYFSWIPLTGGVEQRGAVRLAEHYACVMPWIELFLVSVLQTPAPGYMPIAQGIPGYLRDCFIPDPARLLGLRVVIHLHGSDFGAFYTGRQPG